MNQPTLAGRNFYLRAAEPQKSCDPLGAHVSRGAGLSGRCHASSCRARFYRQSRIPEPTACLPYSHASPFLCRHLPVCSQSSLPKLPSTLHNFLAPFSSSSTSPSSTSARNPDAKMGKLTITVFGSTGKQGSCVVKSILADSKASSQFYVEAATRDPSKDSARALLASLGAKVVAVCSSPSKHHYAQCSMS